MKFKKTVIIVLLLSMIVTLFSFPGTANEYEQPYLLRPTYKLQMDNPQSHGTKIDISDSYNPYIPVVWANGGKPKSANKEAQKIDYKIATVYPARLDGKELDPAIEKGIKYFVTEKEVDNPFVAFASKEAQKKGKELGSCSKGKLSANAKAFLPGYAKLWLFDANGDYGWCYFLVETAPNVIAIINKYNPSTEEVQNGKPSKDILVKNLSLAVGESAQVYSYVDLYRKGLPAVLSNGYQGYVEIEGEIVRYESYSSNFGKFTAASEKDSEFIDVSDYGGKSATVFAKNTNSGKVASAKVVYTDNYSQKNASVTVKIENPVNHISISGSEPILRISETENTTFEIPVSFTAVGPGETTDKISVFPMTYTSSPVSSFIDKNGKFSVGSSKTSDFSAKYDAKTKKIVLCAKKGAKVAPGTRFSLAIVANTRPFSGYSGISIINGIYTR